MTMSDLDISKIHSNMHAVCRAISVHLLSAGFFLFRHACCAVQDFGPELHELMILVSE